MKALQSLGVEKPKLAVAALNPHAGGTWIIRTRGARGIEPAVKKAQSEGLNVTGRSQRIQFFTRRCKAISTPFFLCITIKVT